MTMGTSSPLNLNKIHTAVPEEWLEACSYNHALEQPLSFSSPELKAQMSFIIARRPTVIFFSHFKPRAGYRAGKIYVRVGLFFKTLLLQIGKLQEQDKSSDIEQQPPFGDRKISNIQPQNRGGGVTHRSIAII